MLFYSVWQDPILVRWCFDFSNNSNGHEESVQVSTVRLLGIHQRLGHVRDITPNILDSVGRDENNNVAIISQVVLVLVSLQLLVSCVITLNPVSQQLEELCNVPRSE